MFSLDIIDCCKTCNTMYSKTGKILFKIALIDLTFGRSLVEKGNFISFEKLAWLTEVYNVYSKSRLQDCMS